MISKVEVFIQQQPQVLCWFVSACKFERMTVQFERTFKDVKGWLNEARQLAGSSPVLWLVGNKSDLADDREVGREKAMEYAKSEGMEYVETSAKTGH